MKNFMVFIVGLVIQTQALADWSVTKRIDAMTDEVKKTAIVKNKLGHAFSIYRLSDGSPVWGNFSLSDGMFDQVDWENPPIFRVDKNAPVNLSKIKKTQDMGLGIQAYEWKPKWVNFLIWHGKENEGVSNKLVQIMEGKKIVFRYYLSTGGHKDTSFTLDGAASSISKAINISTKIDHATQQDSKKFRMAIITESKECRKNMDTFKECFSKVNACRKKANNNLQTFNSCAQ